MTDEFKLTKFDILGIVDTDIISIYFMILNDKKFGGESLAYMFILQNFLNCCPELVNECSHIFSREVFSNALSCVPKTKIYYKD